MRKDAQSTSKNAESQTRQMHKDAQSKSKTESQTRPRCVKMHRVTSKTESPTRKMPNVCIKSCRSSNKTVIEELCGREGGMKRYVRLLG